MTAETQTAETRGGLVLGAVLVGVGDGGAKELWRHPEVPLTASVDINWYVKQAREAEAAHFDFVFIVDSQFVDADFPPHHLNRLEPLTLLSALAVTTERIGLVATVSTTYSEPWDIARRVASLDRISGGRAGWNIVTSMDPGTAGNFGRSGHEDYPTRYRRAAESVAVVQALWDSYEDDAFATDKGAERFLDPDKQHRIDHTGEFFSVTGPLNLQRSRQGQPVLVQAGTSEEGRDLSGRVGEIIFSFAKDEEWALDFKDDVRKRASDHGRDPESLVFVPGLGITIRDTDEEARAVHEERLARVPVERQLAALARAFGGRDFSGLDLDAPIPDLDGSRSSGALDRTADLAALIQANGWTLREVLRHLAGQEGWLQLVGSPVTVADSIEHWYRSGAADGFNVFVQAPDDWRRFLHDVVPLLVERGLFRGHYEAETLRGHLGLALPANRYAGE